MTLRTTLRIVVLRHHFTAPLLGRFPTSCDIALGQPEISNSTGRSPMLTNTSNPTSGSKFISLRWPHEIRHWTRSLGCTENELRDAVMAIGYSVAELRLYLVRRRRGR